MDRQDCCSGHSCCMTKPSEQHGQHTTTIAQKPHVCYAISSLVTDNWQEPQGKLHKLQASAMRDHPLPQPVTDN
eukprot:7866055-Alexandrium_andersonii.AAC.1